MAPELERLKVKGVSRARDFLLDRIYDMRKPKTNLQASARPGGGWRTRAAAAVCPPCMPLRLRPRCSILDPRTSPEAARRQSDRLCWADSAACAPSAKCLAKQPAAQLIRGTWPRRHAPQPSWPACFTAVGMFGDTLLPPSKR